jgi:superfamily II DNA helicase RecQ
MKNLTHYGLGKSYSVDWFKDIFNELMCDDYLNEKPIQSYMGSVLECTKKAKDFLQKIKENYNTIKTFETNVKIKDEDKVLLKETKLMKSIGSKNKSTLGDNIFTDDVLSRFNVSLDSDNDN